MTNYQKKYREFSFIRKGELYFFCGRKKEKYMKKTGKNIRFAMDQTKQNIFKRIVSSLPEWNCGRGLLQDFVDCFERRKEINIQMGESVDSPFRSTMPYTISKQQIAFFQSVEAKTVFAEYPELLEEILTAFWQTR